MTTKNIETMSVEEIGKKLEALGWEEEVGGVYQREWNLSEYALGPSLDYEELYEYLDGTEPAPEDLYIEYTLDLEKKTAQYQIYESGDYENAISMDDDYDAVLEEALQDTLFQYVGEPSFDVIREPFSNEMLEIYYRLFRVRKEYRNGMVWWEKDQYVVERHVNVNEGYTSYLSISDEQAQAIKNARTEWKEKNIMASIFGDEEYMDEEEDEEDDQSN